MATTNDTEASSKRFDAVGCEDPDRAVATAYETVSRHLVECLDVTAETHWEVLDAAEAAGVKGEALDALRWFTERYEQAVYAPGSVSADDARLAVAVASQFEKLVGH